VVGKQIPEQARELGISEEEVVKTVMLKETVDGEFTTARTWRGLFTRALTGTASSHSAGHGRSSSSPPGRPGSSQASKSSSPRTTGIRSWIGAMSPFGSVVAIVQVSSGAPSGPRQLSHRARSQRSCHQPPRWVSPPIVRGRPGRASVKQIL
jgi:hypothetical protein